MNVRNNSNYSLKNSSLFRSKNFGKAVRQEPVDTASCYRRRLSLWVGWKRTSRIETWKN